jgi:hypothetical protein
MVAEPGNPVPDAVPKPVPVPVDKPGAATNVWLRRCEGEQKFFVCGFSYKRFSWK